MHIFGKTVPSLFSPEVGVAFVESQKEKELAFLFAPSGHDDHVSSYLGIGGVVIGMPVFYRADEMNVFASTEGTENLLLVSDAVLKRDIEAIGSFLVSHGYSWLTDRINQQNEEERKGGETEQVP